MARSVILSIFAFATLAAGQFLPFASKKHQQQAMLRRRLLQDMSTTSAAMGSQAQEDLMGTLFYMGAMGMFGDCEFVGKSDEAYAVTAANEAERKEMCEAMSMECRAANPYCIRAGGEYCVSDEGSMPSMESMGFLEQGLSTDALDALCTPCGQRSLHFVYDLMMNMMLMMGSGAGDGQMSEEMGSGAGDVHKQVEKGQQIMAKMVSLICTKGSDGYCYAKMGAMGGEPEEPASNMGDDEMGDDKSSNMGDDEFYDFGGPAIIDYVEEAACTYDECKALGCDEKIGEYCTYEYKDNSGSAPPIAGAPVDHDHYHDENDYELKCVVDLCADNGNCDATKGEWCVQENEEVKCRLDPCFDNGPCDLDQGELCIIEQNEFEPTEEMPYPNATCWVSTCFAHECSEDETCEVEYSEIKGASTYEYVETPVCRKDACKAVECDEGFECYVDYYGYVDMIASEESSPDKPDSGEGGELVEEGKCFEIYVEYVHPCEGQCKEEGEECSYSSSWNEEEEKTEDSVVCYKDPCFDNGPCDASKGEYCNVVNEGDNWESMEATCNVDPCFENGECGESESCYVSYTPVYADEEECTPGSEEGECPEAKCPAPPSGCYYRNDHYVLNSEGDCCPKMCDITCEFEHRRLLSEEFAPDESSNEDDAPPFDAPDESSNEDAAPPFPACMKECAMKCPTDEDQELPDCACVEACDTSDCSKADLQVVEGVVGFCKYLEENPDNKQMEPCQLCNNFEGTCNAGCKGMMLMMREQFGECTDMFLEFMNVQQETMANGIEEMEAPTCTFGKKSEAFIKDSCGIGGMAPIVPKQKTVLKVEMKMESEEKMEPETLDKATDVYCGTVRGTVAEKYGYGASEVKVDCDYVEEAAQRRRLLAYSYTFVAKVKMPAAPEDETSAMAMAALPASVEMSAEDMISMQTTFVEVLQEEAGVVVDTKDLTTTAAAPTIEELAEELKLENQREAIETALANGDDIQDLIEQFDADDLDDLADLLDEYSAGNQAQLKGATSALLVLAAVLLQY